MQTIGAFFDGAAQKHGQADFLVTPADPARVWAPKGASLSFAEAARRVTALQRALSEAGYGHGHRIAPLLGNRPEMLLLKLACNGLGISWVPVNPDYRPAEIAYLLQDSGADLAIAAPEMAAQMRAGLAEAGPAPQMVVWDGPEPLAVPSAPRPAPNPLPVDGTTEASLIYTSGTTGRPKGCILSHDYEVEMGQWYAAQGGEVRFQTGKTRVYCPLPLFHVNAAILLFMAVIETGSAQIIPERFSASAWWRDLCDTGATAAHYLGIIIPALMNRPPEPDGWDRNHRVEWAVGAGVEPTLHAPFEARFGFPLIEVWGMTEMCRILADAHAPRQVDTRAMGRPGPGLEVRVVDEQDVEVPRGTPGEMVLRYSEETPRRGAFSGYLNLPEVTEEAWRGGWFHTGDTVTMDDSGMLYFVDRKKNIIRRSGENIAAAEIEACLQEHEAVDRVAVISVPDAMRDEEVMALVVVNGAPRKGLAQELFDWCFERLAYYKAPGWILFMDTLPVTGTQKIQKHALFEVGEDPTMRAGCADFRPQKKR